MEVQEIRIWTIVIFGLVAYLLLHRFGLPPVRGCSNACFFAVGLGCLANGLVHPTRRAYIAQGIPAMVAAVLLSLSHRVEVNLSIMGGCLALCGFGFSAILAWMMRRERRPHAGH
jgi:disulfide bond formation protein DsbB